MGRYSLCRILTLSYMGRTLARIDAHGRRGRPDRLCRAHLTLSYMVVGFTYVRFQVWGRTGDVEDSG